VHGCVDRKEKHTRQKKSNGEGSETPGLPMEQVESKGQLEGEAGEVSGAESWQAAHGGPGSPLAGAAVPAGHTAWDTGRTPPAYGAPRSRAGSRHPPAPQPRPSCLEQG